jgi:hypothetical protein
MKFTNGVRLRASDSPKYDGLPGKRRLTRKIVWPKAPLISKFVLGLNFGASSRLLNQVL